MPVIIRNRQNLLDIAIQETGTIESAFDLAVPNNMSITDLLIPGSELNVPDEPEKKDSEVLEYFKRRSKKIATAE